MLTLCPVRVMPLCKLLFVLIFDYEAMVIIIYECYARCLFGILDYARLNLLCNERIERAILNYFLKYMVYIYLHELDR